MTNIIKAPVVVWRRAPVEEADYIAEALLRVAEQATGWRCSLAHVDPDGWKRTSSKAIIQVRLGAGRLARIG